MARRRKWVLWKLLATIDSHTAYDEELLVELKRKFGNVLTIKASAKQRLIAIEGPHGTGYIKGVSGEEFIQAASRPFPKGPIQAAPEAAKSKIMYGGWQLSAALAQAVTGSQSDSLGRGSAHRANIVLISEVEKKDYEGHIGNGRVDGETKKQVRKAKPKGSDDK